MTFSKEYEEKCAPRYAKTIVFLQKHIDPKSEILDLGPPNPLSRQIKDLGFEINNTPDKMDLDLAYDQIATYTPDVVTAFEIIEHLLNPFMLLKNLRAQKLVASIPLSMPFAAAYWNEKDEFDRHYHEFEPRQFDWLLEKTGWRIVDSEKWISKSDKIGIRPFLRLFIPRYYIVYCERA